MRERGSALMVSVIGIAILLLISGILFSFVVTGYRVETSEEKGLKAFYLAESGIQYGKFNVISTKKDGSKTETLTDPYLGTFTVSWQEDEKSKMYLIRSEGTYEGVTRMLEASFAPDGLESAE